MSRTTAELLREALTHLSYIEQYRRLDLDEQVVVDAICLRLAASIESLSRLAPEVKTALFGTDWRDMWGLRNRVTHGYLLVNPAIIRRTLEVDLPQLDNLLRAALCEVEDSAT